MSLFFRFAGVLTAAFTTALAGAQHAMSDYNNTRFGYRVSYPQSLLKAMPEADNGDGREFQPVQGRAKVAIWGGWIVPEARQTLEGEAQSILHDCNGGKASYRLRKPGSQALSCLLPSGDVLYAKVVQSKGIVVQLRLSYPRTEKSTWDPVATAMSKSLQVMDAPRARN